jgi:hypothetical protein
LPDSLADGDIRVLLTPERSFFGPRINFGFLDVIVIYVKPLVETEAAVQDRVANDGHRPESVISQNLRERRRLRGENA